MKVVEGLFDGTCVKPIHEVKVKPNTRVIITFLEDEANPPRTAVSLSEVAGCLKYNGPAKSIDEMNAAIAHGIKKDWR
jgi:hypothetical protein